MKRLIFCCDGTWNRSSSKCPTNVVKLAQAIRRTSSDGVKQVVQYVEGVGTGRGTGRIAKLVDKLGGGAFGHGLISNIEHAYRALVFAYEPGDEIYILGFSRGAFTARSLAGLIRSSGVISPENVARIPEAIARYQARGSNTHPDVPANCAFRAEVSRSMTTSPKDRDWRARNRPDLLEDSVPLQIAYLGVWDTVGALGVPNHYMIANLFNRKYRFHDTDLSRSVAAARHALAIDERRATFPPALWGNLDDLNAGAADEPRYLEQWFPGDHGSVGGGGDITGLSDEALLWVAEGAELQGLEIDHGALRRFGLRPDHLVALANESKPKRGILSSLMSMKVADRAGPSHLSDVSLSARRRWKSDAQSLAEGRAYRPAALQTVAVELDKWEEGDDVEHGMAAE